MRLLPDMAYNPFTIDEYEVLACWMNTLAAEYHRTHDEKIKAEIFAIASLTGRAAKLSIAPSGRRGAIGSVLERFHIPRKLI